MITEFELGLLRKGKLGIKKYILFQGIEYLLLNISRENYIDLVCKVSKNKNLRDLKMKLNRMFDEYEQYKKQLPC